ncbi:MAG: hypothetical protein RBS20_02090 [Atribacterota bacterium]|jgi:hypothetical protein|nr:hypothetical protein [Atribacterota bacterium]MDY0382515.1 hypothetical protein [Atribacterota bacterium]
MSKKIIQPLLILLFFFTLGTSISSQESLEEILYRDFKDVETFGYINVKVQGEQAFSIGLKSEELTDYARLKYKNNFATIAFQEISAGEAYLYQEEEEAKKVGSIWFRVWTVGEDFPIAYYIECRAGSYKNYEMWKDEVLGFCDEKEIKQIVRHEITRMMENLAITFFKVRGEI